MTPPAEPDRSDIYERIRAAEAWPEEWAAIVIDAAGARQYLAPVNGPRRFTTYRGSTARFPTEARALARAEGLRTATHRTTGRRLHPWITAVAAELIKTKENAR